MEAESQSVYSPEVFSHASQKPSVPSAADAVSHKESGNALYLRKEYPDAIDRYDQRCVLRVSQISTTYRSW